MKLFECIQWVIAVHVRTLSLLCCEETIPLESLTTRESLVGQAYDYYYLRKVPLGKTSYARFVGDFFFLHSVEKIGAALLMESWNYLAWVYGGIYELLTKSESEVRKVFKESENREAAAQRLLLYFDAGSLPNSKIEDSFNGPSKLIEAIVTAIEECYLIVPAPSFDQILGLIKGDQSIVLKAGNNTRLAYFFGEMVKLGILPFEWASNFGARECLISSKSNKPLTSRQLTKYCSTGKARADTDRDCPYGDIDVHVSRIRLAMD